MRKQAYFQHDDLISLGYMQKWKNWATLWTYFFKICHIVLQKGCPNLYYCNSMQEFPLLHIITSY